MKKYAVWLRLIILGVMVLPGVLSNTMPKTMAQDSLDPACMGKDAAFLPFADSLAIYCDESYMYIEADSLAAHDMMIGITAWNQQVPLPQPFVKNNAWRIPLNPVMAAESTATYGQGPIGVAINGVMIYDPTQQDGVYAPNHDPFLIGELDTCGGHSGRADDYHYHITPVCLIDELQADETTIVGYALDGFPIYGFALDVSSLDECGGKLDAEGNYGYYSREDYPYVNGCFSGEVDMRLQPATHPIRPHGEPIQVLITDYYEGEDGWNHLEYDYQGSIHAIIYREVEDYCYEFQFVNDISNLSEARTETYCGDVDSVINGTGGNPPPGGEGQGNRPPSGNGGEPPPPPGQ